MLRYDAVIRIRIDKKTKIEAKKLANDFGVSLTDFVRTALRQIVSTRKIVLHSGLEEPTDFLKE